MIDFEIHIAKGLDKEVVEFEAESVADACDKFESLLSRRINDESIDGAKLHRADVHKFPHGLTCIRSRYYSLPSKVDPVLAAEIAEEDPDVKHERYMESMMLHGHDD